MCLLQKLIYISLEKANSLPITVQIREVENAIQHLMFYHMHQRHYFPASINASTTSATTATTFTFDSPVFLKNYKDYCITIVPAGNSDEYAVWVAQLGAKDVDTGELIDKQPAAGFYSVLQMIKHIHLFNQKT